MSTIVLYTLSIELSLKRLIVFETESLKVEKTHELKSLFYSLKEGTRKSITNRVERYETIFDDKLEEINQMFVTMRYQFEDEFPFLFIENKYAELLDFFKLFARAINDEFDEQNGSNTFDIKPSLIIGNI